MPENGALLLPIAVLFQQAISFPQFTLIMLLLGKLGRIPLHYVFPPCITNQTYRRLQEHFSKKFKQPPLKRPQVCSSRQPTRRRAGKIHYSTLVSQTGMVTVHQVSRPFQSRRLAVILREPKAHPAHGLAHSSGSRAFLGVSPASSLRPENSRGAGAAVAPGDLRGDSREKWKRAREKGEDEERAREMNRFYRAWKYSNKQRRKSEFVHLRNKGMMRK